MLEKPSRLTRALLETAEDMKKEGLLTEQSYQKIAMRLLKNEKTPEVLPIMNDVIRAMREKEFFTLIRY